MKQQTQRSLLKWASLLYNKQLNSIIQIQNTSVLIKLLNILQPLTFQQLYQLDERSSNSVVNILKTIDKYFKKELRCNVSMMIDNLNIYKTPLVVWQLLIGVAIKGKNRDNNIKLILQMELSQQSQLMLLVQDVIEKFTQYEIKTTNQNQPTDSVSSNSDYQLQNHQRRKQSRISNQVINQIVEQNQGLKQRVFELQNQLSLMKTSHEKVKKIYQERINQMKSERYQFLQVLAGGASGVESRVNRSRVGSQFRFRDSIISSSELRVFDDPLGDLSVSITGTLSEIANDMLNAIRNLKKELVIQQQKASLFQDHIKDIKLSFNPLIQQNKLLKLQLQKFLKLQKQCHTLREQNQQHVKNQTEMIKIISQYEQQKSYLREMVGKLKEEKSELERLVQKKNEQISERRSEGEKRSGSGSGDVIISDSGPRKSTQKIDIFRAPSIILRQMNSQLDLYPSPLNQQIDSIKQPIIQQKYQLKILQLRQKNNILRQQNNQLTMLNKTLQNAVRQSIQKSQQIQKNIEQGYKALFIGIEESPSKSSPANDNMKSSNSDKQKVQKKKQPSSPIEIILSQGSNDWNDDVDQGKEHSPTKVIVNDKNNGIDNNNRSSNSKITQFYEQVKKIIQSYEQKQLLLVIEIESLKKQLSDIMLEKQQQSIHMKSSQEQQQQESSIKIIKSKSRKRVSFKIQQQNQDDESVSYRASIEDETVMNELEKSQQQKDLKNEEDGEGNDREGLLRTVTGKQMSIKKNQQQELQQAQNNSTAIREPPINIISPSPPPNHHPPTFMQKSTDIYPPVQFLQIQQGEQFNQNQLPVRKSSDDMQDKFNQDDNEKGRSEMIVKGDKVVELNGEDGVKENGNKFDNNNGNNVNLSELSGIAGSDTSYYGRTSYGTHPGRSHFAKSGFYNQSFIQLSNKLQSQIQLDMNQITHDLTKPRCNLLTRSNDRIEQQQQDQQSRVQSMLKQSINININNYKGKSAEIEYQKQHQQLMGKLQRIKQSYEKVKKFHINSTEQMQTQLKSQLTIEDAEITKLKIVNQQLKQSLTKIISEKKTIKQKIHQMKQLLKTHTTISSNSQPPQSLPTKLSLILNDITQLQHILPQLQLTLQQSKLHELQTLYQQQQLRNRHLNEEIEILLESIVYFRNLAVGCE